ncbi:MAG: hypothetical protein AAB417_03975 [Patescibacteria group bacterium]
MSDSLLGKITYVYSLILSGSSDVSQVWSGDYDLEQGSVFEWRDRRWRVTRKEGDYCWIQPA